jgi:hydrogenase maturation protein HypF
VVRVAAGRTQLQRRSRGYVPAETPLPVACRAQLLACGAEQKNTFGVAKGGRAWVGHHIGDLENWETLSSFTEGIAHFQRLFAVEPEVVAHDLHPEYLSTKHAMELDGVRLVGVQHHHAHLAACLAEHQETGPAVGAIFDGTGYGSDGTVWGGELLVGDLSSFERMGMLFPVRLPGGAAAVRQPWRMACAWLAEALGNEALEGAPAMPRVLSGRVTPVAWRQVCELARTGVASPLTTSMGRLFDAVAALCGIRAEVNYEGQAAVELEACSDPGEERAYPLPVEGEGGGPLVMDARAAVAEIARELEELVAIPLVAARFHNAVAEATARACVLAAGRGETETVVLSGGVFQNRRLLERAAALLGAAGLRVLVPERLPPNDGGIAYGQLAVAAARLAEEAP